VFLKVAVLLGGTSAERDVFTDHWSGKSPKAIRENGHQVMAVDCAFGDALIEIGRKI